MNKEGLDLYCLTLTSIKGDGLSASPTVVQGSHAYHQCLKKADKDREGTKHVIKAEGLISETQKYPFGKPALFAANRFQQPI